MSPGGETLRRLLAHQHLSRQETAELFGRLMDGELSEAMKAALLVALAMKGETSSEIAGAADAMRRRVVRIPHRRDDVVDTCGTGGDQTGTFNISTAAALVAAAAGVPIAKHGNRSVSSKSGSADVLEALGVKLQIDPEIAARALETVGMSFLFAPNLHPAMKEVMPVRRELGVRTIFNILGPLTNPAGAKRQIVGVYQRDLVDVVGRVLLELGAEHALVVHGFDGLDEITTTDKTSVAEVRYGRVESFVLDARDLGAPRATLDDLRGGSAKENAAMLRAVVTGDSLAGRQGLERGNRLREITAVNAAGAIYVGGLVDDLATGYEIAMSTLESGAAARKLEELRLNP